MAEVRSVGCYWQAKVSGLRDVTESPEAAQDPRTPEAAQDPRTCDT